MNKTSFFKNFIRLMLQKVGGWGEDHHFHDALMEQEKKKLGNSSLKHREVVIRFLSI